MKNNLYPLVLPSLRHYTFKNLFSQVNVSKALDSNYRHLLVLETGADLIASVVNHHLCLNSKVRLLLPNVFCDSTLRFVRSLDVSVNFYTVNDDFSPNMHSVSQELSQDGFNILLVVHFFGHYQRSVHKIKKHLACKNVAILEDFAHFSTKPRKTVFHGDYLLFSPRKHLPISAGAFLLSKEKIQTNIIRRPNYAYELFWTFSNLFKRYISAINWKKAPEQQDIISGTGKTSDFRPRGISRFNKNIINKHFFLETQTIRATRASCLRKLQGIIEDYFDSKSVVTFLSNEIPYGIPLLIDTEDKRQKALRLKEMGLPIMIWPDFPVEAIIRIGKENLIRRRVALFICHEQVDLKKFLEKIKLADNGAVSGYKNR